MVEYKKSLLISNILDPLTHDQSELQNVYQQLSNDLKYESIETRLIRDKNMIQFYNQNLGDKVELTYWITGEIQRDGLNLSSVDESNRIKAVAYAKNLMKIAQQTNCQWFGIASGQIETTFNEGFRAFYHSLLELLEEIEKQHYPMSIILEPLDQFAHKCNVIGTAETTLKLLEKIPKKYYQNQQLSICFDTAHVALNEDDFEEAMRKLSPYISRVHFANAILDKQSKLYGDYHLDLCEEGFLNISSARQIKGIMDKYLSGQINVAMEIREKDKDHAWILEKETFEFLNEVLK